MEILKWWNLSAPLHMTFSKFSEQWLGLIKERKCKDIWTLSLGCVVWSLWHERNQIKFESKSLNFQNFVTSLKLRIGTWAKEMMGLSGYPPHVIFNVHSLILRAWRSVLGQYSIVLFVYVFAYGLYMSIVLLWCVRCKTYPRCVRW